MYASTEDIETELCRELDEVEARRAQKLLTDALVMIKNKLPDIINRAGRDDALADLIGIIQTNAACRVLRNPDGIRDEREGDYAVSSVDQRVASGYLSIMPSEWKQLGANKPIRTLSFDAWRFRSPGGDCE